MKKRIVSLVACALATAMVLGGCSSSTSEAPAESEATTEAAAPAAEESAAATEEASGEAEYAVILKTQASDFWVKMANGVQAKADELGVKVDILAAQSEEDTEGQLKIFENCLTKNYKAIGIAPLSPVNVVPAVVEANKKGIYVMNIDEKIDMDTLKSAGGSVIAFATTDNVAVGEKGAQAIIDAHPDGGKVAIIEGKAGNASGEDRKNGATKAFEGNDKFELVASLPGDWDRQKALDAANTFIQQYPDIVGIYCCNDTMALGAVQAVVNANKLDQISVVGTDGDTEAVDSVNQGQMLATVAQDPAGIGATSLEAMIKAAADGGEISADAEPETIPVDSQLITK